MYALIYVFIHLFHLDPIWVADHLHRFIKKKIVKIMWQAQQDAIMAHYGFSPSR